MQSLQKTMLVAVGLALFPLLINACGKQAVAENSDTKIKSSPAIVTSEAAAAPLAVNDIADNPKAHLGHLVLAGVVGTVESKKGFVVVDKREYDKCGLSCLNEGAAKVPVRWTGAAPKVTDTVRVEGTLAKSEKGLIFTAEKIVKP